MPKPSFDINDLVAPVGRQSPYPFTLPSPAQQNPQQPVHPSGLVAQSGELNDLLNQSPETQFLGKPQTTPPPSPTPAPVKKEKVYAT